MTISYFDHIIVHFQVHVAKHIQPLFRLTERLVHACTYITTSTEAWEGATYIIVYNYKENLFVLFMLRGQ